MVLGGCLLCQFLDCVYCCCSGQFCPRIESCSCARSLAKLDSNGECHLQDMAMLELNCASYVDGILKDLWPPAGFVEQHSTTSSMYCLFTFYTIIQILDPCR